jgi:predicted nucleotide-binding protein
MALRFKGELGELKAKLFAAGIEGEWSESNGNHQLRDAAGGVINWSPTKGTIWCQGAEKPKAALEARVAAVFTDTEPANATPAVPAEERTIFVVHGHDTTAREQLELVLHKLGLQPFVLMNSPSGDTIIEALEKRIGRNYTSDSGIVLFTPDDIGYARADGGVKAAPRAR